MGESGDLNVYASSTFTHACHALYNIVSKLSNARSLVSKCVLEWFLSKFLWLYGFFNFFEKSKFFEKFFLKKIKILIFPKFHMTTKNWLKLDLGCFKTSEIVRSMHLSPRYKYWYTRRLRRGALRGALSMTSKWFKKLFFILGYFLRDLRQGCFKISLFMRIAIP